MKSDNIIFLSHPYTDDTPSYGNRDIVKITTNSSIESGASANSSCWVFTNNHIGTHIDTPYHFDSQGSKILDFKPSDWLFNNVALIDIICSNARLIESSDINVTAINPDIDLLLIRTGYEKHRKIEKYWNDNPGIKPNVALFLRDNFPRLRCIGIDFISLSSWRHRKIGGDSHRAFLCPPKNDRPILAIEDMSLINIMGEIEWVVASPLLVDDGNGAPVTVFANIL